MLVASFTELESAFDSCHFNVYVLVFSNFQVAVGQVKEKEALHLMSRRMHSPLRDVREMNNGDSRNTALTRETTNPSVRVSRIHRAGCLQPCMWLVDFDLRFLGG